ncbi:MAG: PucR family transcriptional regulator ligand-binding domain-containing protein [Carboxylicivirga sp.]|jgi:predicted transcriptional regulator|nr:PucR family transcriptional regulator ligand-binding domain-containing protein [Carboxylicivirga sp.]MCT4647956.1 PucR family transcriptional regulator ligand-binding domain-containing protein [Carboxylicivirga sp.]
MARSIKIKKIAELLNAKVVCGADFIDKEVEQAFASDLMSDVLTLESEQLVLITGLTNMQTVRTAEMADIDCVVFVRGKKVTPEMIEVANENNMVLVECEYSMFRTIGMLYEAGVSPVY